MIRRERHYSRPHFGMGDRQRRWSSACGSSDAAAGSGLCIYACEVAGLVGLHHRKSLGQAVEAVWARLSPATYNAALQRHCQVSPEQQVEAALQQAPLEVQKAVAAAVEANVVNSSQARAEAGRVEEALCVLDPATRVLLRRHTRSAVFTGYGTRAERAVLDILREQHGMALECDPYFRSRELGGAASDWRLGGRSDALLADCSGVVEVKNRVGRLLGRIRTRDRVQLQTYMWVIGAQQGWLAECYRPSGSAPPQVNLLRLAADEQWFEQRVLEPLRRVAQLLALLASCQRAQDEFLSCGSRGAFVEEWCARGGAPIQPPVAAAEAAAAEHPLGSNEMQMLQAPAAAAAAAIAAAGVAAAAEGGGGGGVECGAGAAGGPPDPAAHAPVTPPAAAVGSGPAEGHSPTAAVASWLRDSEQGYGELGDDGNGSPECYTQRAESPGCYTQRAESPGRCTQHLEALDCYTQRSEGPSCYTQRCEVSELYCQPSRAPEFYTQCS